MLIQKYNPETGKDELGLIKSEDMEISVGGDINRVYNFVSASTIWEQTHNLGKIPALQCFTIDGEQMEGDVVENTTTKFKVQFTYDQAGYVVLN